MVLCPCHIHVWPRAHACWTPTKIPHGLLKWLRDGIDNWNLSWVRADHLILHSGGTSSVSVSRTNMSVDPTGATRNKGPYCS